MQQPPKVSIVILNWNGRNYLEQFLPAVLATRYARFEVIVADNASTDASVSFLREQYPDIRCLQFPRNYGFARGYNEALKQIVSDYYVLLNSDVEVMPGWLAPMVALLEAHPEIAACQPKILSWHRRDQFEYAGAAGGWLDKYGYPFARGRIFDVTETDHGQYDNAAPVFWASGAAMFIRAEIYHKAGGLDPYFFAHQEEIDLCWRIQLLGYEIWACPQSVVYHVGGGTLPRGNSLKTYLNFRNNRIMLSKNLPLKKKIWILPVRNLLDAVSAWKGLLSGDGGYFVAIIRAHLAYYKWWLFYRHQSVFPVSRNGPVKGYSRKNMIWQHFVRKRRNFSEIIGPEE